MKVEVWEKTIWTGYLVWVSWQDIRTRSVSVRTLLLGGGAVLLDILFMGWGTDCMMAWIPGAFLLLLSRLTNGIGEADGILLLFTGFLCGEQNIFLLSGISLIYIFFYSMILFMIRKNRNGQVPYLPFLLAAYITTWNIQ